MNHENQLMEYREKALQSLSPVISRLQALNQPFGLLEYGSLAYGDWVFGESDWDAIIVFDKGNLSSTQFSNELAQAFSQMKINVLFKPNQKDIKQLIDDEIDSLFFHTIPEEGSDIDVNITTISALRRLFHYIPQIRARMRIKNWSADVRNVQGVKDDQINFERIFKFNTATGIEVSEKRIGYVAG